MTITMEWVEVEGFPGYSVNPLGEVRKDSTGRVLHTRLNQYGVPYVGLMRGWKQCIRSLPKLVATAFIPRSNAIFDTPINLNGDRTDCRVDNLMWRPRWYAVYYANQFRDRYDNPINAPVIEAETGEEFENSLSAACRFGLLEREVVLSILNRTLTWPTYQQFELLN
jgi:NUMOD4 motif